VSEDCLLTFDSIRLRLKSPRADPTLAAVSDTSYVHLCTSSKTFRLRQVHSSNSIHLIRPGNGEVIPIAVENDDAANGMDLTETVTAIGRCGSTLEVHAVDESFSATQILEQQLRLYDRMSVDGDTEMGDVGQSSELSLSEKNRVMDEILDDVPTSAAQCQAAWTELCAFVQTDTTSGGIAAFRPSARVKVDMWRRILEGSVLQSIDLEKQFLVKDLWKAVLGDDEEQPFPPQLLHAVVQRLSEPSLAAPKVLESFYSELKCKSTCTPICDLNDSISD
jgi:sister chromatid cohesion protein DCC1